MIKYAKKKYNLNCQRVKKKFEQQKCCDGNHCALLRLLILFGVLRDESFAGSFEGMFLKVVGQVLRCVGIFGDGSHLTELLLLLMLYLGVWRFVDAGNTVATQQKTYCRFPFGIYGGKY